MPTSSLRPLTDPPPASAPRQPALLRLLQLRGVLVAATLVAAVLGGPLFSIVIPFWPLLLVAAAWLGLSGALQWQAHRGASERAPLFTLIALDVVFLTAQLALSGGPASPLTALYLPLMVAAAALLPQRRIWGVLLLVTAGYASLWWLSLPLTVEDAERATQMHLLGMWATFLLSAVLVAGPLAHITLTLRQRERELAAAQQAALVAERIGALGAQAAGAAHELGTPLNTIALLAEEIRDNADDDAARTTDVATLLDQVKRCKEIIGQMLTDAGVSRAEQTPVAVGPWLQAQVKRFRLLHPECTVHVDTGNAATARFVPDIPLTQGLMNLLQNACDASPRHIHVGAMCVGERLQLAVRDQGPGFSEAALARVCRAPFSDKTQGMGMGLLLTAATVERLGGRLSCSNRSLGGAEVLLDLPLAPPPLTDRP